MEWIESPLDFILDAGLEKPTNQRHSMRGLDNGVEALFRYDGNERKLVRIYFKKIAKIGYPYTGAVFKTQIDCEEWLQRYFGKIIAKLDDNQRINRYEASTLVSLQGFEGILETYKIFGKDKNFMEKLRAFESRHENVPKTKIKRNWL